MCLRRMWWSVITQLCWHLFLLFSIYCFFSSLSLYPFVIMEGWNNVSLTKCTLSDEQGQTTLSFTQRQGRRLAQSTVMLWKYLTKDKTISVILFFTLIHQFPLVYDDVLSHINPTVIFCIVNCFGGLVYKYIYIYNTLEIFLKFLHNENYGCFEAYEILIHIII